MRELCLLVALSLFAAAMIPDAVRGVAAILLNRDAARVQAAADASQERVRAVLEARRQATERHGEAVIPALSEEGALTASRASAAAD